MNLLQKLLNKINRRILNLSLWVIKNHIQKQKGLFIYTYNRELDKLEPITWKARGITFSKKGDKQLTNDWDNINKIIDYSGKIVVDIGANLGLTPRFFAKKASLVYGIEPHPDNYRFLLDQIKIRKLTNIKTYECAISDFNGNAKFYNRQSHGIHSLGVHNKGKILSSFDVKVISLDEFWKKEINEKIGLLKIDVEGFEADVLQGAKYLLSNKLIDAVIFEFSPRIHKLRKIDTYLPINILLEHGYEVLTTDGDVFKISNSDQIKICDLIALPRKR